MLKEEVFHHCLFPPLAVRMWAELFRVTFPTAEKRVELYEADL